MREFPCPSCGLTLIDIRPSSSGEAWFGHCTGCCATAVSDVNAKCIIEIDLTTEEQAWLVIQGSTRS